MAKRVKQTSKFPVCSLTEKELRDYTEVQEKVLFRLREQFHLETAYPYSIVESQAERLLREYLGTKTPNSDPTEVLPVVPLKPKKPTKRSNKVSNTKTTQSSKEVKNTKLVKPKKNEQIIRTQSFPRRWQDVDLTIGMSKRSPSTEVNLPKSSKSSVTTIDSLPSEVSSGFYDQFSINKYWQDGIYEKSVQPHFFFENHVACSSNHKKTYVNPKLIRPWRQKNITPYDSIYKSRPRSPLRITQPGRSDCSAFSSIESRDKFLASLSACPIISTDGVHSHDIDATVISPTIVDPFQTKSSIHISQGFCNSQTDKIVEDILISSPEINSNDIENETIVKQGISNSRCTEDDIKEEIPTVISTPTQTLALALIPLPWHDQNRQHVNNNLELENLESSIVFPEPVAAKSSKNEYEVKPIVRKARSICSIVRLSPAAREEARDRQMSSYHHINTIENLTQENLTPKQSRLMIEIDQILARRTSSNFKSANSSKTENALSVEILQENTKVEQSIPIDQKCKRTTILLPSEKQMLSRLSDIFSRFDYQNAKNVINPKLKKDSLSKSKTNAKVNLPAWPEWKFDISLFPKAENLIAEAKELVNSSDSEVNVQKEPGAEFVIGNITENKLWEESKINKLPPWFRKVVPHARVDQSPILISSKVAKRKDDLHPRKLDLNSNLQKQNEKKLVQKYPKDPLSSRIPKIMNLSKTENIPPSTLNTRGSMSSNGNTKKTNSSSDFYQNKIKSSITGSTVLEEPIRNSSAIPSKSKLVENSSSKIQIKRKMLLKKLGASNNNR